MDRVRARWSLTGALAATASVALLATAACAPPSAAPTAAPVKAAPTAAPAPPAPTTAPPKVEAPAPKPAPTAVAAAKPTEKPAAKAAEYDEKAVADFYRGKTVRIVVGYAPGGATDTSARLLQKVWSKHIPGNPSVVVENKPGGGGLLAANTVYNSEPRDGTVVSAFSSSLIMQQALGAQGVQVDVTKLNWLGSTYESFAACAVRLDAGINSIQDLIASGKELPVSSFGKGTTSYDPPATMNAALGTKFKIVTGYEGGAAQRLAVKNGEVPGFCTAFEDMNGLGRDMFEGSSTMSKVLVVMGDKTPDHPFLKGVPAAETLARTDEARAMLKAVHVPFLITLPHALAPDVPKDRVQALRRARDKAYADPELLDAAKKAQQAISPRTGEEVARIAQEVLNTPPAVLAKLKTALE